MLHNNFVLHLWNNVAKSRSTSGPEQNIPAFYLVFLLCKMQFGQTYDKENIYFSGITLINTGVAEDYWVKEPLWARLHSCLEQETALKSKPYKLLYCCNKVPCYDTGWNSLKCRTGISNPSHSDMGSALCTN